MLKNSITSVFSTHVEAEKSTKYSCQPWSMHFFNAAGQNLMRSQINPDSHFFYPGDFDSFCMNFGTKPSETLQTWENI